MVHLIIGYGEVGQSLHKVLKKAYWVDLEEANYKGQDVDVVHICFPYNEEFETLVSFWKHLKNDVLTIVHSTVPVGTCDRLGVVHSPITGVHPNLAQGIRTFTKFFGGEEAKRAERVFKKLGIKTRVFREARTTEALKLWSTTQYGRMIMLEKEIYEWCEKNKLDFDEVYTLPNIDYNEGYTKLGMPQVVRPYLKHVDGPIGGHCVLPNAKLLGVKL